MEELKKIPIEREEINFENRLSNLDPRKKFSKTEIVILIGFLILFIGGSYALNYYLPQNNDPELNQAYYTQGAIDISNRFISELLLCSPTGLPITLNESYGHQNVTAFLAECLQQGE